MGIHRFGFRGDYASGVVNTDSGLQIGHLHSSDAFTYDRKADLLIPGSSNALTFKTMADALVLRNHLIECFERVHAAADVAKRRACLTIVVIGCGLVGDDP